MNFSTKKPDEKTKRKELKMMFKLKYGENPPSHKNVLEKHKAYKQVAKVSNKHQGDYRKVKNLNEKWQNWCDAWGIKA